VPRSSPLRKGLALSDEEVEFLERLDSTVCRSGCPTQDHASYKDCLKAAHFGVAKGETARGQY